MLAQRFLLLTASDGSIVSGLTCGEAECHDEMFMVKQSGLLHTDRRQGGASK